MFVEGSEAHLVGDWTLSGTVGNISSLSLSLQQINSGQEKHLRINCGLIGKVDTSGMQLLRVWMECARIRGVVPHLTHVTEGMKQVMQHTDFCSYGSTPI